MSEGPSQLKGALGDGEVLFRQHIASAPKFRKEQTSYGCQNDLYLWLCLTFIYIALSSVSTLHNRMCPVERAVALRREDSYSLRSSGDSVLTLNKVVEIMKLAQFGYLQSAVLQ